MSRRVAALLGGIAAGFAVAAAIGLLRQPAEKPSIRAVPDSEGHVVAVLIHWDPETAEAVFPAYRDLTKALGPDARIRVAVERPESFDDLVRRLRDAGVERLERLAPLVIGRPITTWSRDRFVTAVRGGKPLLLTPPQMRSALATRANDWIVPWTLAADPSSGVSAATASFVFDGGDFVADRERIYATALVSRRNAGTRFEGPEALRAEVSQALGLDAVILGDDPDLVPDHHIGMFVTPIGSGAVVVGDPGLAEDLLVGSGRQDLLDSLDADVSEATRAKFDLVAEALSAAGARVVRIPLLPTNAPWVWITFNNVLIDDRDDGRHLLLPSYGIPELDDAAREIWRSLGFEIDPIDVSRLYLHGGTIRCVAAVLERVGLAR